MTSIVNRAMFFAAEAHASIGQVRKYTKEPYINHPRSVVAILQEAGIDQEDTLAAAWLHDVVEDTPVSDADLRAEFGDRVADLVAMVTDVSTPRDGNRATRKAIDRDHLAQADKWGQSIKLADLIDNTRSIVQHDPNFAAIYLAEKEDLLRVLTRGDAGLLSQAWSSLNRGFDALTKG